MGYGGFYPDTYDDIAHHYEPDEEPPTPPIPPELTEDYLATKRRAEAYMEMMEESLNIFDADYWYLLFDDMKDFYQIWVPWSRGMLIKLGVELSACLLAGCVVMMVFGMILTMVGPIRIKTLGMMVMTLVIGSIIRTEGVEVAASSILGIALIFYLFLDRVSTGTRLYKGKVAKEKESKGKEPPAFLVVDFWYVGERSLWLNLSKGYVGITSE